MRERGREREMEIERERGGVHPSPVKWDSFPCVHILSWLRFSFFFLLLSLSLSPPTLNSRIRQATSAPLARAKKERRKKKNVLVSWPRLSREPALRELLVDRRRERVGRRKKKKEQK